MTNPAVLLETIYKADPAVGDIFLYDVALQIGEEAMRELKEEIAKWYPQYLAQSSVIIKRSLGRSYVENTANGRPEFDPELLAAYQDIAKAWEEVGKAYMDRFEVNGNTITVYRDAGGRFTRQGAEEPKRETATALTPSFYHPVAGAGSRKKTVTELPRNQKKWAAETGHAPAFNEPAAGSGIGERRLQHLKTPEQSEENQTKSVLYGLQSQKEANDLVDILEGQGVIPANGSPAEKEAAASKLQVTALLKHTSGQTKTSKLQWDSSTDTFRLPDTERVGFMITEYSVEGRDDRTKAALTQIQGDRIGHKAEPLIQLQNPFGSKVTNQVGQWDSRAGLTTSRAEQASHKVGIVGRLMQTLGIKGGKGVEAGADRFRGLADDDKLRETMTRAGWRFRGIDAPKLSPSIEIAVEGPKNGAKGQSLTPGFDEARMDFYDQALPPNADIGEAIEMGAQRDLTSQALWARQRARMSNAGMGMGPNQSNANYNALAQRIAQGIGRGMPSEGVLIDRKGKAVSQSMGITHDGFLPFNADGLSKLSGGQYVRTRQLGGLTGEDLRTLLVGNGRAAQVISNSGVYEIEMDPSLRGTRRYNDTAMQMIDTYDRILDEISDGGHYAVPLPAQSEKAARESAAIAAGGGTPDQYRDALRAKRHEQYNKLAQLDEGDIKNLRQTRTPGLRAEYHARYGSKDFRGRPIIPPADSPMSPQENAYVESEIAREAGDAAEQRARMLSLNSEGYALALKTLSQFYPYMIRTARYRTIEQFNEEGGVSNSRMTGSTGTSRKGDAWYTPPGKLRPSAPGREPGGGETGINGESKYTQTGQPAMGPRKEKPQGTGVIRPGGRVNLAAPAAGGAVGTVAAPTTTSAGGREFQTRLSNQEKAVRADLQSFDGFEREDEDVSRINDVSIKNANSKEKVRQALILFANEPADLDRVLRMEGGAELRAALSDQRVAQSLISDGDNPVRDHEGNPATLDQVLGLMHGVSAVSAAKRFADSTTTVGADIEGPAHVPAGDGPVMISEGNMTSKQITDKIAATPALKEALTHYEKIQRATNASHIDPYDPVRALDKANGIATALRGGTEYDDAVNTEFASKTVDADRLALMEEHELLTPQEAAGVQAMLGEHGRNRLLDGTDPEGLQEIKNSYRLGHGLWIQQFVHTRTDDPNARSSLKARGPATGLLPEELGKSLDSFLEETLGLSLTPSRAR